LALAVEPPDRLVHDLAGVVPVAEAEQILETPRSLVKRMSLQVEPDVALVRRRQETETAIGLVGQQLEAMLAGAPRAELQLRLMPQAFESLGPDLADRPVRRAVSELLERGHTTLDQLLGPRAAHPGDEREVVVVDPLLPADVAEVADTAVCAR